jgi:hypothetical protein
MPIALAANVPNTTPAQPTQKPAMRVLFIGNSFTYKHDMPLVFGELAQAGLKQSMKVGSVVQGGQSLAGHWKNGTAEKAIRSDKWNYVVLQDQSAATRRQPRELFDSVRRFATLVRPEGATPVVFETWANARNYAQQKKIAAVYKRVGRSVGIAVIPVGDVFFKAQRELPNLNLYERDQHHPNKVGTYLNACVFYARLIKKSPVGLPAKVTDDGGRVLIDLKPEDASALQRVAAGSVH